MDYNNLILIDIKYLLNTLYIIRFVVNNRNRCSRFKIIIIVTNIEA